MQLKSDRPTALVTGSAGFIGRHMCAELLSRGYDVTRIDRRENTCPPEDARTVFAECSTLVDPRQRFDLVVHCAYLVGGRATIDNEHGAMAYNVELDSRLFAWAKRTGQRRVLYFSSSAVYPTSLQIVEKAGLFPRLHEGLQGDFEEIGRPDAAYGFAKLVGEQLAREARKCGLPVTVVRPFSGYGSDQGLEYPFPAFVDRAAMRCNPFVIWGHSEQRRDWIHVDDVVRGALAVADSGTELPVNLCMGRGTSMITLASMICAKAGYSPRFKVDVNAPYGVFNRVGDPSRMLEHYTPRVILGEGIERAFATRKSGESHV